MRCVVNCISNHATKQIKPAIKVRKNSIISSKNNKVRNKEKLSFKQEISLNGRRKENMENDGL